MIAAVAFALLLSLPATLLLMPLWAFIERDIGIEALGHSGPAEWCYLATATTLIGVAIGVVAIRHRRCETEAGKRE